MTEQMIDVLRQQLERRLVKRERQQAGVDETDEAIAALRYVIALQRPERDSRAQTVNIRPDELVGLIIEDAAVLIAERSGGLLKSTPARKVMIAAGLLDDSRNGGTKLYQALSRSERFESVQRGEYRLIVPDEEDVPDEAESEWDAIPTRVPPTPIRNGHGGTAAN